MQTRNLVLFMTVLVTLGLAVPGSVALGDEVTVPPLASENSTYIVGFYELPEDRETYQGEPVTKVNEVLKFFVVESENPVTFQVEAKLDDRVRYLEEESRDWQLHLVPNDEFYNHAAHWGSKRIGGEAAWDTTLGSTSIKVAHLDSGLNKGHEEFANSGRVLQGYDFYNGDNDPDDTSGCNYHGTHTTGTAGASIDNVHGIAGMSQHTILPVKIFQYVNPLYGCSTTTSAITDGLMYAADQGAHLSSNSWGGGGSSTAINDAIAYAHNAGTIHVASAGNSGPCTNCVGQPWTDNPDKSIVVSSLTDGDTFSDFSSQGPEVDIIAPGDYIAGPESGTDSYVAMSGTSMAAPHVTGSLA
ncbi:MAG: S8 family serine peptidase, partial [Candidatus Thermoplasmatota archaeon]|nr:S8 family serine peptidase [Candidatus Thermoplasmatota archaeon]